MGKSEKKSIKITLDQYYGITDTKKAPNNIYIYLRYRNGQIKERTSLPSNFYELSKVGQQKEYKLAKEILDIKLGLSKEDNINMRKATILSHIEKYLADFFENNVKDNPNKQVTFDSTSETVRHRIERHTFAKCTIEDIVNNDIHVKEYFKEAREGFYCKEEKKEIKPVSKSSIDKEVQLLLNTLKFIKFEKKWISADDYETIVYQIKKYRAVGSYSKKNKTKTLSAYEFALFRKEILERKDTTETYLQLFTKELEQYNISKTEKEYVLYLHALERAKVDERCKSYSRPDGKINDFEKLISIYEKVERKVKEQLENGFMTEQADLHYPIIRYYKQKDGSWSINGESDKNGFADFYVINRKNKSNDSLPYYYNDGSLNALFLLFNINTGMRFNENRSLKVSSIKHRLVRISTENHIDTYYLEFKEQVQSVIERDEFGKAIKDENNKIRRKQIITDPKTNSSIREIPLNNTALEVLEIIQDITGTKIFNEDGSISEVHSNRYIFVNYKKHENMNGKNMGREAVFINDFRTHFTYGRLRDTSLDDINLVYHLRDIEDIDSTKIYYYQQILNVKKRIENGEEFNWSKQIYVIKPPSLPSNSNVNKTLKRILSNMRVEGYEEFSVHDLRRTTSSIMSQNGHKTLDIQHIIGHAENSSVTEEVYIKTNFLPALTALQELDDISINNEKTHD